MIIILLKCQKKYYSANQYYNIYLEDYIDEDPDYVTIKNYIIYLG